MSQSAVSKRYAAALFDIALESKLVNEIEEELTVVKQLFSEHKKLIAVLSHPKVPSEKKKQILKDSFGSASTAVLNTLYLLIDRSRISIVPDLADEYVKMANRHRQTEDAVVYSVKPLSEEEIFSFSQVFAKKAGAASLRVKNEVDPDLIGGVKIRIGNRIYDGSVSGKLARIERQLAGENRKKG
ncbi:MULTISPECIES: F0F1 ATP synthase subunit delta [Bacillus]|uniref:ATP synthase subunit delta n=1 Tax=Bacillus glycinifermentans TaxID=1664069 RepID=A0AAJ4D4V6_9BACI|nr:MULTISPECIES: F0F1 ATP synthase subunit delta [Bacillus]KKB74266.1 ATP synthase F0F1 subunit delta [Bacillus sp. TH008]MBU8787649.1 F0F1 ATP synthase subunit delta [Bacillus glycinifermentans]MDU0071872.1 F0F1 ATP synthase subunit delta [Bacillus sp. IG6]MED8019497.1 F0F1 ATP synthase subunit delta [Bacillus glycinifermentans]NUJ17891.1 F0F1 ATP synthase subunit delta [Bacillus glycinifermentans]